MRRSDWDLLLFEAVEAARNRPFEWGVHDCATWAHDVRRLLTDADDLASAWRGRYTTARGAARVMRRLGWKDLEEAARAFLGEPLETPLLAQRGDIVSTGGEAPALGVCLGAQAAFLSPEGLTMIRLSDCRLAWRI